MGFSTIFHHHLGWYGFIFPNQKSQSKGLKHLSTNFRRVQHVTLPETNSQCTPEMDGIGRRSFPFGARSIFRGEIAASCREANLCSWAAKNKTQAWGMGSFLGFWVFPKINGTPQITHFNRGFPLFSSSILGFYHHLRKHPFGIHLLENPTSLGSLDKSPTKDHLASPSHTASTERVWGGGLFNKWL